MALNGATLQQQLTVHHGAEPNKNPSKFPGAMHLDLIRSSMSTDTSLVKFSQSSSYVKLLTDKETDTLTNGKNLVIMIIIIIIIIIITTTMFMVLSS